MMMPPTFPRAMWPVLERVAREEGVTPTSILGRKRCHSIARARRRLMAVLRWSTDLSYPELGRMFDRDHTTVIAACRKYEAELAQAATAP